MVRCKASRWDAAAATVAAMSGRTRPEAYTCSVQVLDLGQVVAGNFCGAALAYFGADVIKVEPPGTGDALRSLRTADKSGNSLWWRSYVSSAFDLLGKAFGCITICKACNIAPAPSLKVQSYILPVTFKFLQDSYYLCCCVVISSMSWTQCILQAMTAMNFSGAK